MRDVKNHSDCERTETFDFIYDESHSYICKDRNVHSYYKLTSSAAGWHFLQSSWKETDKISLFIMPFMLKPSLWLELNLLWRFCRVFFFFLIIETSLWDSLLIKKTISSYLTARAQSAEKITAGLKGGTYKQEVKFSVAQHMKRWREQDETSQMNEWHKELEFVLLITAKAGHPEYTREAHFWYVIQFTP